MRDKPVNPENHADREAILLAGDMMSDKGYSEGSLDNPQFLESQKRYNALFERTAWENWKPIKDIQ